MGGNRIKPGMICAAGGGTDTCQVGFWWSVDACVNHYVCRGTVGGLWSARVVVEVTLTLVM